MSTSTVIVELSTGRKAFQIGTPNDGEEPELHSVLDIYAEGQHDIVNDLSRELYLKIRKMRAVRARMERRIASAWSVIDDIDPVLKVYERDLKRLEAKRKETIVQRRGL